MAKSLVQSTTWSRALAVGISALLLVGLFAAAGISTNGFLFWFHFNPYSLLSFVPFVANVAVLWVLVRRPARTDERVWLGLYMAGSCVWSFVEGLQRISVVPEAAVFWAMMSGVVIVVMAPAFYLFALSYTNRSQVRHTGTIVGLMITAVLVGFFYAFTELIFKTTPDAVHLFPWGYNNDSGSAFVIALAWIDLMYILGIVRLVRFRQQTANPILRKQSLIFVIAVAVPLFVGSITDGVLPALDINTLPPLAMFFTSVTTVALTYGVLRYKLLTINPVLFSETILSIIHEAVVVTDDKFTILYTNPEARTLLGLGEDAAGGQRSLLHFLHSENHTQALKSAYEGHPKQAPESLNHIDVYSETNHKTPVRVTNSRLPIEEFNAYVMVLADITAELQSKSIIERTVRVRTKELHEARAYLVASINSLEQGFILVDQDLNIELTNAMAQVLMNDNTNLIGRALGVAAKGIPWDIKLEQAVRTVLQKKRPERLPATTSDGRFYVVFVTPVLAESDALGAAIIVEDVTEQRILERSKDEFFSIASHELRTPLTAIRGNLSMAREYYPEAMKDKSLESLVGDAHDASIRLIEVVNDFLDSSRLEQGKMAFNFADTDVKPVIDAVRKDFEQVIDQGGNALKYEGLDNLPTAYVDADRLKQILYNILSNSYKFTQKGTVTIAGEVKGKKLNLRISDTGIGITPENQKLLFHKFQQAGDSLLTRDTSKGTGLGLYISRLLSENMGGSLVLERSEPGKGSTFLLTLPLASGKTKPQAPVKKTDSTTGFTTEAKV